jgi:hypothetical protein
MDVWHIQHGACPLKGTLPNTVRRVKWKVSAGSIWRSRFGADNCHGTGRNPARRTCVCTNNMQATLLPDELLVLRTFEDQLGPIEYWYDGTLKLRPAGDARRIELETAFFHEVSRLRTAPRALIVSAVISAFAGCEASVRARLSGSRRLRGLQLADVDLLELRIDEGSWLQAGEVRAA